MNENPPDASGTRLRAILWPALLLALVLAVGWQFFMLHLDAPSIHNKDEYLHVSATQSMWQGGSWWLPTVQGEVYLNKPPLKMWLTFLPLAVLGESNQSYRLIDGLAGMLLLIVVFAFVHSEYHSPSVGALAAAGLLACGAFFAEHGFHSANQDALLLVLVTVAMAFGYRSFRDGAGSLRAAVLAGVLTGLA
ncbi:MAG: glycosyltransferase family 39 protein, partial [Bdellovibrionales bacterium]|nr:glycosyltransferase family 39 protein [Bdellovibrionales bacterium]